MLSLSGLLAFINDTSREEQPELKIHREVYYRMSLHIDGACPRFWYMREDNGYMSQATITPYNWFGIEYQKVFDYYLYTRHIREAEITRQWRLSQHKPFTQQPFQQVIQVVTGAIFQDSNFSISVKDTDDNDYVWGNNFDEQSLPNYVASSFQDICNDPNGIFVAIPKQPWFATTTPRIEPEIIFVRSKDICHIGKEEILYNRDGYLWAVNSVGYFRFKKNESTQKWEEVDGGRGYYAHMLGYMPVFFAGGQWNSQGFWESHLNAARAVADEFVAAKSAEQLVMKEASHPIITEASVDCPECTGTGKIQVECTTCPGGLDLVSCGDCKGTGNISRNPGERLIAPSEEMVNDLVKFTNPDTSINELHLKNNADIMLAMMKALHLNYVDEAQSGTAKDKDMETRYQFIDNICNDLFDRLITGFLRAILSLRNVRVSNGNISPAETEFIIVKPTQYAIKTAQDLLDEYDTATKAGTPSFMRAQQLLDYQDKQFGGNDVLKKKTEFILQRDPMAVMSGADKSALVMSGAFELRDVQLSGRLPTIFDQITREKSGEWIKKASYDEINVEVERLFALVKPPMIEVRYDTEGQ